MQQPSNFIPRIAPYPALPDGAPGQLPPLEPAAVASFPLHPFAQRSLYLYSMVNFAPLIEPILESLKPAHIAEVGSERGNNTLFLYRWCTGHGARLTLVDTHPNVDPEMASDPKVSVFQGMSVDYFKEGRDLDVVFLDGDHNYETVTLELAGLERQQQLSGKPLVVFMHDVAWPCDRRDMYYDPQTVSDKRPFAHEGGVEPFHAGLTPSGPGGSGRFAIALTSGGPRNGVLTAVEDFLASRGGSGWRFHMTPVVHGLGILWWDPALTEPQRAVIADVTAHLTRVTPFLAAMELNRIALGVALNAAGIEWARNIAYIKDLETRLTASDGTFQAEIRRLIAHHEQDAAGYRGYIEKIEAQLAAASAAHEREQAYIRELEGRAAKVAADHSSYVRHLEGRLAEQAAAIEKSSAYIRELETNLSRTGGAHTEALAYIRTLEASLEQHHQYLLSARADCAASQAFADQQSRAVEAGVTYIRTLEARLAQLVSESDTLARSLAQANAQHASLSAEHARACANLAETSATLAQTNAGLVRTTAELDQARAELARLRSILQLPATRLFWGRVRGTLPVSADEHPTSAGTGA
jgi:hypothetical protein